MHVQLTIVVSTPRSSCVYACIVATSALLSISATCTAPSACACISACQCIAPRTLSIFFITRRRETEVGSSGLMCFWMLFSSMEGTLISSTTKDWSKVLWQNAFSATLENILERGVSIVWVRLYCELECNDNVIGMTTIDKKLIFHQISSNSINRVSTWPLVQVHQCISFV